jgi:hypothetical protein
MQTTQYVARPSFRDCSDNWAVEKRIGIRKYEDRTTFLIAYTKWFKEKKLAIAYANEKNKCLK